MIHSIVESAVRDVLLGANNKVASIPSASPALKIVVLDRGWIVVGCVRYNDGWTIVEDASVIRNWGTSKGLGEIAANGPTEKTILDKCPAVRARTVIMEIECDGVKWPKL